MAFGRAKRVKYVHRRAGSGGNETDTIKQSTSVESEKTSSTSTEAKTQSTGGVFLATSSSSQTSSTSSAKSVSSIPTVVSVASSVVNAGISTSTSAVIPTSISSIVSDPLTLSTISVSDTISSATSGKQFIASSSTPSAQQVLETSTTAAPSPPPPATVATSAPTTTALPPSTSAAAQSAPPAPPPPPPDSISSQVSSSTQSITSILVDTGIESATTLPSLATPTFTTPSTGSSEPATTTAANLLASAASASTGAAQAPAGANSQQPITSTGPQGFTTTTIVGTAVGAAAGVALLALLALYCIRRRYRNSGKSMSPFSRRQAGGDRASFPPVAFINEDFRPGPAMLFSKEPLFSKESLSTIDEKDSSRSYTPPVRHSRSYTTSVLPPSVPARSVARPLSNLPEPKQVPATNPFLDPIETIDASFMGTISAYFSDAPTTVTEPFLLGPNGNNMANTNMSKKPSITSVYSADMASTSLSPRTSVMPPITPALPTAISAPQGLHAQSPSPPPTSTPSTAATTPTQPALSARASSSALGPSRYQSMGHWRDSMWSTSATPIMPTAMASLGTALSDSESDRDSYFSSGQHSPSSHGHRLSKSLSSAAIGTAQSLYSPGSTPISTSTRGFNSTAGGSPTNTSPTSAGRFPVRAQAPPPLPSILLAGPASDSTIPLPPRSPLRAWPLRGMDSQ